MSDPEIRIFLPCFPAYPWTHHKCTLPTSVFLLLLFAFVGHEHGCHRFFFLSFLISTIITQSSRFVNLLAVDNFCRYYSILFYMGSYCSLNNLPISILHVLHSLTSLMFPPTLYTFPFMFTVWKMKIDFMSSPWFPQLSQLTNSFGNLVSFIWIIPILHPFP